MDRKASRPTKRHPAAVPGTPGDALIVCDAGGTITYASGPALRLCGRDDLVARRFDEVFEGAVFAAEDAQGDLFPLTAPADTPPVAECTGSDGLTRTLSMHSSPLAGPGGFNGTAIVLSEEGVASAGEEGRADTDEREVLFHLSSDGRITFAGPSAATVLGFPSSQLQGMRFRDLLDQSSIPVGMALFDRPAAVKPVDGIEVHVRTGSHETASFELSAMPAMICGRFHGWTCLLRDLPLRKQMEKEAARYLEDLTFLSRSALHFVQKAEDEGIFRFIAEHIHSLLKTALVIVTEYDTHAAMLRIRSVAGRPGDMSRLNYILWRDPIGMSFSVTDRQLQYLRSGSSVKTAKDLRSLNLGLFPDAVCHEIELGLNVADAYAFSFTRKGEFLGNVVVLARDERTLSSIRLIEAFIGQSAVALKRRKAEAERERLLSQVRRERGRIEELAAAARTERDILDVIMENTEAHLAYLDARFNFIRVNASYARGCGYSKDRLVGMNHFDLFPDRENRELFERVRDTGEAVRVWAKPFSFPDRPELGTTYWNWTLIPTRDEAGAVQGMVLSLTDVTRQKRNEERVEHAAREWRITFDSICDPVSIHDTDGRIVRVNRAFADLFGAKPEELIGMSSRTLICGEDGQTAAALADPEGTAQGQVVRELYLPAMGGHREVSISPVFDERMNVVSTVHVFKDITERKRAEEVVRRDKDTLELLVREKSAELLNAQRELEETRRLSDIGVLAATIAHEVRNPLAAIRTAAYNIRRKSDGLPVLEKHIANIEKKVMESDQIIKNLLSYSRIKAPNYESVRLKDVLEETIAAVREKYSRGAVALRRSLDGATDDLIDADPVHLRVLFGNLLDNAYQSLPDGEGTVSVALSEEKGVFTVLVRDTGTGIAEEDLARIFEPFFTRKSRGVGLGLAVCQQIVNLHSGTLSVASTPGQGTDVSVHLPSKRREP